jgi:hypothetical protein
VPGEDIESVFDGIRPQDIAEQLVTGKPNGRDILKFLVLGLPLRDESVSQVSRALESRPSFLIVWIGNNDILGMATRTDPERHRPSGAAVRTALPPAPESARRSGCRHGRRHAPRCDQASPRSGVPRVRSRSASAATVRSSRCRRRTASRSGSTRHGCRPPPCSKVLSVAERAQARANVQAFNAEITAAAAEVQAARGITIAVVDIFGLFDQIATSGVDLDGNGTPDLTRDVPRRRVQPGRHTSHAHDETRSSPMHSSTS